MEETEIVAKVDLMNRVESIHELNAFKLKVKSTGNPYLLAHLLSHLGHLQTLEKDYEKARETLNEADFVLIEAAQRDSHESAMRQRAWLRYMIERGRFFSLTGWLPSAQTMLADAVDMARNASQFDLFQEARSALSEVERELA